LIGRWPKPAQGRSFLQADSPWRILHRQFSTANPMPSTSPAV